MYINIIQQAFYTHQRPSLCQKCKFSTVPSIEVTMQRVRETRPSSGASPSGVWAMLKQLKDRILASGPVILNVFQKVKNAIWQGCVYVGGCMVNLCCFVCVCTLVVCSIVCLLLFIVGFMAYYLLLWLTGGISIKITRRTD
jgi:hypothetical protein